jgi:hypothetical protein
VFKGLRSLRGEVERTNVRCAVILVNSSKLFGNAEMAISVFEQEVAIYTSRASI